MPEDIKVEVHALAGYVSMAYLDPEREDGTRTGEWKYTGNKLIARWTGTQWDEVEIDDE